jgi:hydrogenase maturation protease
MKPKSQQRLNLFTWGNPSRGDDAIGPRLHQIIKQWIADLSLTNVQLIEDFQLQPEHVFDIDEDACVLFIDASYQGDRAYQITEINKAEAFSYTTHSLSPEALLTLYEKIQNKAAPPAFLCSIRGYNFDFDTSLSIQAEENIKLSAQFLKKLLTSSTPLQLLQDAALGQCYA